MRRFFIFISLHLFLFLLVIAYQAQAQTHIQEEEWSIEKLDSMSYARVSGEVIHGDNLNFFIQSGHDCEKVWNNFTFVTYKDPGDIKQLLNKHIPITINGEELTAEVESISPFLSMGWRVLFTIGVYPIKEYINHLNNFYTEEKKFEIESANIIWKPNLTVNIEKEEELTKLVKLNDELEDNDDVQNCFSNLDFDSSLLEVTNA